MSAVAAARPKRKRLSYPYEFRAQFNGRLTVMCPKCGKITQHALNWNTWHIQCKARECRTFMVIGLNAHVTERDHRGKSVRPVDMCFPAGSVIEFGPGNVHSLSTR